MKSLHVLTLAFAFGALPAAQAAPVVDQSHVSGLGQIGAVIGVLPGYFDNGGLRVIQTFTVGLTGVLTGVDFAVWVRGTPTANLVVEIVSGSDLLGTALASVTAAPSAIAGSAQLSSFTFAAANLAVEAGDQLAIRLSSNQDFSYNMNQYEARGATSGSYSGGLGRHWYPNIGFLGPQNYDYDFRTYVDPSRNATPEPGALGLVMGALALLTLTRRSQQNLAPR